MSHVALLFLHPFCIWSAEIVHCVKQLAMRYPRGWNIDEQETGMENMNSKSDTYCVILAAGQKRSILIIACAVFTMPLTRGHAY